jgi:DNA-directed RNA polymerase specialized sigma24 family protein
MSALQLAWVWAADEEECQPSDEELSLLRMNERRSTEPASLQGMTEPQGANFVDEDEQDDAESDPAISLAFYRKHTERILRRYLYASMQVGRAPAILNEPVARGWVSSRPVRTFEDAVIFVLDVEKCLERLSAFDQALLSRIVLQEYTQAEAASLLSISARTVSSKFPRAVDRLTEWLMKYGILVIPES